jgi:anti-sigma factor RsiW
MFGMPNDTTPCEENQEKISALLDAELPPKERKLLQRHLSVCVKCRTLEEWLRCIKAGITKSAHSVEISEVTREKILGLLRQIPQETPKTPWWKRILKRK